MNKNLATRLLDESPDAVIAVTVEGRVTYWSHGAEKIFGHASAKAEVRDLAASYRLGANSYVLKPMDFFQYGGCVRTLARYWVEFNRTPKPGAAG